MQADKFNRKNPVQSKVIREIPDCLINFSVWELGSLSSNPVVLDKVAVLGKVRFHLAMVNSGNGRVYLTINPIKNPTWLDVIKEANKAVKYLGFNVLFDLEGVDLLVNGNSILDYQLILK